MKKLYADLEIKLDSISERALNQVIEGLMAVYKF
jgi:hypothetical protein